MVRSGRTCLRIAIVLLWAAALAPEDAEAEPADTEIPGVTAELAELRQSGGVLRLAVRYANGGATAASVKRFDAGKILLVDVRSKQKHFPLKDATGAYVAGPIGDSIDGGRLALEMPPGFEAVAWAYFEPLPPGTVVSVELPQMFPFDDVPVTEGAGALLSSVTARSIPFGAVATLVSAKRADQALKVRLKLAAEPGVKVDLRSPYFEYKNVYLFDPAAKRRYPLLKDGEGRFEAQPLSVASDGGSFIPNWSGPILMSLTFQAPPDAVTSVDLVLPDFLPLEGVAIEGLGGAGAGGIAAGGKSLGLEGALKELQAEVTPQEIKIDLSADVLFDFDKAELKPAAEQKLSQVLTVVSSKPGSKVLIEGHTDVRGDSAYNQALSERRAQSVRAWLAGRGVEPARITATGAGESRPIRTGDTEEDHQANRRVEIRIRD
jgi:outer membrane protein OmpA-like peptidoglycan-associated protein